MITFLEKIVNNKPLKIVISNPTCGDIKKVSVRPAVIGGKEVWQFESFTKTQVFHENVETQALAETVIKKMDVFRQLDAFCSEREFSLKITKKGKILTSSRKASGNVKADTAHNREKNYILKEGNIIPPLVDLGVMTADGRIVKAKSDKFRQINRFVEIIDDVIGKTGLDDIKIIDFGCGKSYLTFILYYYLTEIKGMHPRIIGLDLKEKVIEDCNEISKKYGYDGLTFEIGDINGFKSPFKPDMVISLHACDTATDHAIYNALNWDAKYCFFVPCCQHEINLQLKKNTLPVITDYGITRERFAALITDNIRARLLTACGHSVDMLEFIDISHSPKNILIRAVKTKKDTDTKLFRETGEFLDSISVKQTLFDLLKDKF